MLGPIEIESDGERRSVGGPRIRRLLGALVLARGAVCSIDALVDAVWGDGEPPPQAHRTLMSYVSRLRSSLPEGAVEQRPGGYRLDQRALTVDLERFESSVGRGRRHLRAGRSSQARASFEDALASWQGEPLGEFRGEHWAEAQRVHLLELWAQATEGRLEAMLELGLHREAVADIEAMTFEPVEREHFQYLAVLGLYRAGRQAEALRRYQTVRSALAEIGLDPSPELRHLEQQILVHDEELAEPSPGPGRVVRGYELGRRIATGSSGEVFEAVQQAVGREVAIRVIRSEYADQLAFVRRFELEAQLVARLEHPHIVPLYDYWREPGGAYLVMRLLRGGSARDRLRLQGPLPLNEVNAIVEQIGAALGAAHGRGVVHGHLDSGAVLFDEDGLAYLSNFDVGVNSIDAEPEPPPMPPVLANGPVAEAALAADIRALARLTATLLTGIDSPHPGDLERLGVVAPVADTIERAMRAPGDQRTIGLAAFLDAYRSAAADLEAPGSRSASPATGPPVAEGTAQPGRSPLDQIRPANPYKGLLAFEEADAPQFYGRAELIDDVVSRLMDDRLVALVGPSGSGKSSVLRAGVIPALNRTDQLVVMFVPGQRPYEELGDALLRVATSPLADLADELRRPNGVIDAVGRVLPVGDMELVLIVDQLEELFTMAGEADRMGLLDALAHAVTAEGSRLRLLVAIRADFFDRPLGHRRFGQLLQGRSVNLLPLAGSDLLDAIVEPARSQGISFAPDVVEAIRSDVDTEPASLPLLQYTLTELYDRRENDTISLTDYESIGRVAGAVAGRAEDLYSQLSAEDRQAAQRLFLRLVIPGEGAEDTRRRASRAELTSVSDGVIDAFGSHRLLSFDRDPITRLPTVEVAHEALIRAWPRLRDWVDGDRDGLRLLRHLSQAAAAWRLRDHDPDELYRGGRLDSALAWVQRQGGHLAEEEQRFLDASVELRRGQEQEATTRLEREQRQNRRLRRSLVGLSVVVAIAVAASVVAFGQRSRAQARAVDAASARSAAETRRLISDAGQLAASNRRVALLLAAEAYRRDPGPASIGALKSVLTTTTGFLGYVGVDAEVDDLEWTADGRLVGVGPTGLTVLDPGGGLALQVALPGARLVAVRSDARLAAVASSDSSVWLVDVVTGERQGSEVDLDAPVTALAFSADGSTLAIADRRGVVYVLKASEGGNYEPRTRFVAHPESVEDLRALSAGGLPAGISPPRIHDPLTLAAGVTAVAVDATGSQVATVGGVFLRVWDAVSGAQQNERIVTKEDQTGDRSPIAPTGVGYMSRNGVEVVAVSSYQSAELWSPGADSPERWPFPGVLTGNIPTYSEVTVAFGRSLVVSVAADGRVAVASAGLSEGPLFDSQLGKVHAVAVDAESERVAVAGADGVVVVSLIGDGLVSRSFVGDGHMEWYVSNDGRSLVANSFSYGPERPSLWRWDGRRFTSEPIDADRAYTGQPIGYSFDFPPTGGVVFQERDGSTFDPVGPVLRFDSATTVEPSADGRWIASGRGGALDQASVTLYDKRSRTYLDLPALPGSSVLSIGFNPDSTRMVAATDIGYATVYDLATGEEVSPLLSAGGGAVVAAKYTPDGRHLVTAASTGALTIRDAVTLQPSGEPLLGNTDGVQGFALDPRFSPDGRWMVTTIDGELRLWDLEHRQLIGEPFPRSGEGQGQVSADARFATTVIDGRVVVWDLDVDRWSEIACEAAGRNLTELEWLQFGPAGEAYQVTCTQWPGLGPDEHKEEEHE